MSRARCSSEGLLRAGYGIYRRLEALDTETPERPPIVVLKASEGQERAVANAYWDATPKDKWAEVVVVVRR